MFRDAPEEARTLQDPGIFGQKEGARLGLLQLKRKRLSLQPPPRGAPSPRLPSPRLSHLLLRGRNQSRPPVQAPGQRGRR